MYRKNKPDTIQSDKEMSFIDHLDELRWRLVKSAACIIVLAVIMFIYTETIIENIYINMSETDFITYRYLCTAGKYLGIDDILCASKINLELQSIKMTGQFGTNIYFAIIAGIVMSFPFILFQLWSFVKPGLKANEIQATKGIVFYASVLFFTGIFFGYFLISPLCVQFFGNYTMSDKIKNIFTISDYISVITTTTFYTGLLFELPVIIYILTKLGIVGPDFLRRYRKHAVVVVLILAAIITPPDFFSQILVAIPILLLYEISIMVSSRAEKKQLKPS
jgi:sec-independent protein translocase protein TatC